MRTTRIQKINVISAGITGMLIPLSIGVVYVPIMAIYTIYIGINSGSAFGSNYFLFMIPAIIIWAVIGFIYGIFIALIYNWAAKFFGGLKIHLSEST